PPVQPGSHRTDRSARRSQGPRVRGSCARERGPTPSQQPRTTARPGRPAAQPPPAAAKHPTADSPPLGSRPEEPRSSTTFPFYPSKPQARAPTDEGVALSDEEFHEAVDPGNGQGVIRPWGCGPPPRVVVRSGAEPAPAPDGDEALL